MAKSKKSAPKKAAKAVPKKATKAASKKKAAPKKTTRAAKIKKLVHKETAIVPPVTRIVYSNSEPPPCWVDGTSATALFSLRVYRGEGMSLLAMDWKIGKPPANFVGFAIEYKEPDEQVFYAINNRLSFLDNGGNVNPNILSSRLSPIQKFRWVHFPYQAAKPGEFLYRVTPVFMSATGALSYGDYQEASIQLLAETYPDVLNIAFTRGFIASQAFIDRFGSSGSVSGLLPAKANDGLDFKPTDSDAPTALAWMGFEARAAILALLDEAIADTSASVKAIVYDFNDPEILTRMQKLGSRLQIIMDDSGTHKPVTSCESRSAVLLAKSAGADNVKRQHMGELQHNKTIIVNGNKVNKALGGSTNLSWRGIYVQNNNAVLIQGEAAVSIFSVAFDSYWAAVDNKVAGFEASSSAVWNDLKLPGIDAKVSFSPHSSKNALLDAVAKDIATTKSSLLFSLAFLYQTPGALLTNIEKVSNNSKLFVYGLSDKSVKGLDIKKPGGNDPVAFPGRLLANAPEPFKPEISGGSGITMHHKFVVIDFDLPTARVYTGSYNFSSSADTKNGENLFLIKDKRVAISYMIEGVAMFDHYEFRDLQAKAKGGGKLYLRKPPAAGSTDKPWWDEDYTDPQKARDRTLFAGK